MTRTTFGSFVCFGDSVTETRDGVTFTVRVEHDPTSSIDDDEVHTEDRHASIWNGASDETYERAMAARAAYFRNEWHYGTLIVSAERYGWSRDYLASVGAVEINYPGTKNEYLDEVAGELIDEAEAELAGLIGGDDLCTPETVPNALERAEAMLSARSTSGDDESDLVDALTDLRHWAKVNGLDFGGALTTSHMHYDHETDSDPDRV